MDKFSELIKENSEWAGYEVLKRIEKLPQRQDSLTDQMKDLYNVANKFGLYDAADYIRRNFIEK